MRSIIKINNFYKPRINFSSSLFSSINSINLFRFSTSSKVADSEFLHKVKGGQNLSVAEYKQLISNLKSSPSLINDPKIEQVFTSQLSTHINDVNSKELNDIMTLFMHSENLPSNSVINMIQKRQEEISQSDAKETFTENSAREERRPPRNREERSEETRGESKFSRENQIYVSNLPWSARDEDLVEVFSKFGDVTSANVIADRETGKSRGFGFVSFATAEGRDAALQENHQILGRAVAARIAEERKPRREGESDSRYNRERGVGEREYQRSYSESGREYREPSGRTERADRGESMSRSPVFDENKTVFVGNLDFGVTEEKVRNEFSQCGNIAKLRLPKNLEVNVKGMCFIEFESENAVEQALRKSGVPLNGRNIRVNKYTVNPPTRSRYGEGEGKGNFSRQGGRDGERDFRRRPNSEGRSSNYPRRNMRNEDESD
jgi:nucleolin